MKQRIDGIRYDYIVDFSNKYFEITAIRKTDSKKSAITNLNLIISEIIEPILKISNIEDSCLKLTDFEEGKQLFEQSIDTLKDKDWVEKYLESELDEDFQDMI